MARAARITPSYLWAIEHGEANPTIDVIERIAAALDVDVQLVGPPPIIHGGLARQRDLVHAWASAYADRRLRNGGWETAREVEIVHGRSHGWIDLLAFDRTTRTLLIIEIKTQIDDIGAVERQLDWYSRAAPAVATARGWRPTQVISWLLVLQSEACDAALRTNRAVIDRGFERGASAMLELLRTPEVRWQPGRGLAMIDPASHRRDWLIRPRIHGRRSDARYTDYRDAAEHVRRR